MKNIILGVLFLSFILSITSCGSNFEATAYVEASLNALYKGEYDAYAEFRNIQPEDAKEEIEKIHQAHVEEALAGSDFSKEQIAQYAELEIELYALLRYEVLEAVEDKDENFTVPVTLYPNNALALLTTNVETLILEEMQTNPNLDPTSPDVMFELLIQSLEQSIETFEDQEAVVVELSVTKDDDGHYGIDNKDMKKLESTLLSR